jgi:hypothetical protein
MGCRVEAQAGGTLKERGKARLLPSSKTLHVAGTFIIIARRSKRS